MKSTVFHGMASPWHSENAYTNNPCPLKVLWVFSPHRGLASPPVTVVLLEGKTKRRIEEESYSEEEEKG